MKRLISISFLLPLLPLGSPVFGESNAGLPETVSYYEHVRPSFQAKCQGCHQPAKAKSDYIMTDVASLLRGGEIDVAVVPGKPDESYLMELIVTHEGETRPEMPPKDEPLSDYEVSLVKKWIEQGARDDTPENALQKYTMENPPRYAVPPLVTSMDYSPDGTLLAMAGFHEVLVHRADGSGLVSRLVGLAERIQSVAFSPDGTQLLVAGGLPGRMGEIQIWDLEDNELKVSEIVGFDTAYGASWSPDGSLVAFGLPDNTVRGIKASNGEQVLLMGGHNDWVLDTTWSVKGDHLVSVGRDMSAKLTEVETERFVDNITSITPGALKGGLNTVTRHPNEDHILVGGSDGVPQIYRMHRETARKIGDNANLIRKYPAMKGRIWDAAFSPDGKTFAAVSSLNGEGEISLYRSEYDATITPELKKLFETARRSTKAEDNINDEIEKFHTAGAEQIAKVEVETALYAVAFSPDGKTIATAGADGSIRLLNANDLGSKVAFAPISIEKKLEVVRADPSRADRFQGKPHDQEESLPTGRKITAIEVSPKTIKIDSPNAYRQVIVTARLDSGETADLTRSVSWKPRDP
ncbi:MAG: c-type cytochrome domain-containing protein, partial [Verrucomicrobiota bacterium]